MAASLRKRNTTTTTTTNNNNNNKVSVSEDTVAKESLELAKDLNYNHPDAVIDYIQHFGHVESVFKGRVVGVDAQGIDCLYTIAGNPKKHPLRIQFDEPVKDVQHAKQKLNHMAEEAHRVLHYNIDKQYKAPNAPKQPDWSMPSLSNFVGSFLLWIVPILAIQLEDEQLPHSVLVHARQKVGGVSVFENIFTAIFVMHVVEAVVAAGMCVYARTPVIVALRWIGTVFVFGIPCLQQCLKVCVRYAMHRDPVTFGVPENVLNGNYMKYRRILTDADLAPLVSE